MRELTAKITIGEILKPIRFVHKVRIEKSWKKLTDNATVILPKNLQLKSKNLHDLIKKGDAIKIELGYDGNLNTEFDGYVTRIKANTPVEIQCEDQMWLLKKTNLVMSWDSVNLQEMIRNITPGAVDIGNVLDLELGSFRINNVTPAKVLEVLREKYGLVSFFRNGSLNVGFPYPAIPEIKVYNFQSNIAKSNLEYKLDDDLALRVRAISIMPDNTKIEIELGDPEGEVRTLHYYNISDKAELKKIAESQIGLLKAKGYRGNFEGFGVPVVEHSNGVRIEDNEYPERAGTYFVDSVIAMFGVRGYRRRMICGRKIEN